MRVDSVKIGLVAGLFLGMAHALWATLVLTGMGQPLIDFIFRLHFISPPYHVESFEAGRAALLVGITFAIGMIGGFVAGAIWNFFHHN